LESYEIFWYLKESYGKIIFMLVPTKFEHKLTNIQRFEIDFPGQRYLCESSGTNMKSLLSLGFYLQARREL